jgi:diaminopimelate epimerase
MKHLSIIRADPAGNITIFVLDAVAAEERRAVAAVLLQSPSLAAEQVGFVERETGGCRGHSGTARLTMAGGEFCGNAARSFGFYAALRAGSRGAGVIDIAISGASTPLSVEFDIQRVNGEHAGGTARARLPLPRARKTLRYAGRSLPLYVFDGIHHAIVPEEGFDNEHKKEIFADLKERAEEIVGKADAFGTLFFDRARVFCTPLVGVESVNSLVFEKSCGSGTAALACEYFLASERGGEIVVNEPGGTLTARVEKSGGTTRALFIGGALSLERRVFPLA